MHVGYRSENPQTLEALPLIVVAGVPGEGVPVNALPVRHVIDGTSDRIVA